VEGTGSYGAGLARHLSAVGIAVVAWILANPPLGRLLAEDALSQLTCLDSFVEFLIAS